eukprot:14255479-Ditylum_brightwellii.AAC.1
MKITSVFASSLALFLLAIPDMPAFQTSTSTILMPSGLRSASAFTSTQLYVGVYGSKPSEMGMGKSSGKRQKAPISDKRKLQIKESVLKEYSRDIAKGTEQRV